MRVKTALVATIFTLLATCGALAVPLAAGSQLNINGLDRAQPDNSITTLDMATGLDFTMGTGPTPGTAGVLSGANGSGTFAALGVCDTGSCGSIRDIITFTAFAGTLNEVVATLPGGTVSLDLNSPVTISRIAANPSVGQLAALTIAGPGTLRLAGYDATPAQFTLTTQGSSFTTFSASAIPTTLVSAAPPTPAPVPEPFSLVLLASGLSILGVARRLNRWSANLARGL